MSVNRRVLPAKLKIVHATHFFPNVELFAITDSDKLIFSNKYLLN